MKCDAIIFDFDGVIADSEVVLNQALADGLTSLGLETSLSDSLRHFSGKRWADILDFSKLADLKVQLDIGQWEMNRTHWAIKDEDLFKILASAGPLHTI